MTIEDQIRDEKLQYDINREAAKKYCRLINSKIIEQAKFTYSRLERPFEKQIKTIEYQGEKQVNALKSLESSDQQLPSIKDFISEERLNPEIDNGIEKIEEGEERKADRSKMVYEGSNKTYNFRKFKTIWFW